MKFSDKKEKIIKLLKKESFIYQVYSGDTSDHLLGFFKIKYRVEGNLILIEKFLPINAYEIYFREHLPIGCYIDFKRRSVKLNKYGIKLLIVVGKVQSIMREGLSEISFLNADELLSGIKKGYQITKLIDDSAKIHV